VGSIGTAVVFERKLESKKPDSTLSQSENSLTKSKLFAGAITSLSLMVQIIMLARSSIFMEIALFVFPILCAVLAIIFYIKSKRYKFIWVVISSLVAFIISPLPLWILMLLFYPVILAWFLRYTIISKRKKTSII